MKNKSKLFSALALISFLFSLLFFIENPKKIERVETTSERDFPQKRIEWEFKLLRDPATNKIPENIRAKELAFAKSIEKDQAIKKNSPGNTENTLDIGSWQSKGPSNIGGRTRALAYDISDLTYNTILAGGASGGMWRTADGGTTWSRVTQLNQLASVTTVAQDTRAGKTNTWYYGTGERLGNSAGGSNDDAYLGDGIFKSVDGGLNWSLLPATSSGQVSTPAAFSYVWRVAVDASNTTSDEIYAAVLGGIMRSLDGGATWTRVLGDGNSGESTDISITTTGVVYATISGDAATNPGIWRSTTGDAGDWTNISPTDLPNNFKRTVLGAAPSNENIVYFLSETPGAGTNNNSLWKYTYVSGNGSGAGGTWENRSAALPDGNTGINAFDSQGGYNYLVAVKPDNPDVVFIGGVDLVRSTNGFGDNTQSIRIGGTGSGPLGDYPGHFPDQHAIVFLPTNPNAMLSGNDGGVFFTNDNMAANINWTSLNNMYITTQYYGIAIDYSSTSKIVTGGMQDRGNFFINPDISNAAIPMDNNGLDGTMNAIAANRTAYYFGSQSGGIYRANFTDNGTKSNFAQIDPFPTINGLLFVNPYAMDPVNSEIMYFAGLQNLMRTNSASTEDGSTWTTLNNSAVTDVISAIGISKANSPNVVYYGTSSGEIYRLDNANAGDPNRVDIWSGKGLPNGFVNNIAVDKTNSNNAVAVFTNYGIVSLFYTNDAGNSWTPISGNLEENPDGSGNGPSVRWATILNYNNQTYYLVATSTGVYSTATLAGMNTQWSHEGATIIGNSVCVMVLSRDSDGYIAVGSHGNGLFTSQAGVTDVSSTDRGIPNDYLLAQNYPNPFNPTTSIEYHLPKEGQVKVQIYDMLGNEIKTLVDADQPAGNYRINWNGTNNSGVKVTSGSYVYRLVSGSFSVSKKMLLIK